MNEQGTEATGEPVVQFVDRAQVKKLTSLGTSAMYEKMANDEFPRGYLVGSRNVRWKLHEIIHWINTRPPAPRKASSAPAEGNGQKATA